MVSLAQKYKKHDYFINQINFLGFREDFIKENPINCFIFFKKNLTIPFASYKLYVLNDDFSMSC